MHIYLLKQTCIFAGTDDDDDDDDDDYDDVLFDCA